MLVIGICVCEYECIIVFNLLVENVYLFAWKCRCSPLMLNHQNVAGQTIQPYQKLISFPAQHKTKTVKRESAAYLLLMVLFLFLLLFVTTVSGLGTVDQEGLGEKDRSKGSRNGSEEHLRVYTCAYITPCGTLG